jgi:hypothetical protein
MATITKGKTFVSGEVVTPSKLHELVDAGSVSGIVNADVADAAGIVAGKLAATLDLSGKTLTLPAGQGLSYPVLAGPREGTAAASGTSGTITVNLQTAGIFTLTPTGNVTGWTVSNPPASGTLGAFVLRTLGNGTAYTWVWPTTTKWAYGETPTPTSTNGKYDLFSFFTFDGGTTWFGQVIGQNY